MTPTDNTRMGRASWQGPPRERGDDSLDAHSLENATDYTDVQQLDSHTPGQLPPLEPPQRTALEQAEYDGWLRGWQAAEEWYWPRLERAERDADVFYDRAYNPRPALRWGLPYAEHQAMIARLQEQRANEQRGRT